MCVGQIIQTKAQFGNKVSLGEVHLETDFVLFRGDFRLKIYFKDISSIKANDGKLNISFPEGEVIFFIWVKRPKYGLIRLKIPKVSLTSLE